MAIFASEAQAVRPDHQMHIGVSAVSTVLGTAVLRETGMSRGASYVLAGSLVMLAGYMREQTGPMYDRTDMGANMIGVLGGVTLGWAFEL